MDSRRRQAVPLRVRRAFRAGEADSTVYYAEIERSYRVDSTDPSFCPGSSLLKSRVRSSTGTGLTSINDKILLLDCDEKIGSYDTPVAYWEHRTGVDLLVRRLGWESEHFTILTIDDGGLTEQTEVFFENRRD